jgi:hypothetical protein
MIAMKDAFGKNQKDLSLDDIKVIWTGQTVSLYQAAIYTDGRQGVGRFLTSMEAGENTVAKIQGWCVKNCYRCSQIQNDRILL